MSQFFTKDLKDSLKGLQQTNSLPSVRNKQPYITKKHEQLEVSLWSDDEFERGTLQ